MSQTGWCFSHVSALGAKCAPTGRRASRGLCGDKLSPWRAHRPARKALYQFRSMRQRKGNSNHLSMLVDPWSISPAEVDQLAGGFFAASLFPYLAFLAFIGDKRANCPPLALNGFRFLLVFVGATIPAGIAAKVYFNDILANVDVLHGSAESLLTITNLLIVEGFRRSFLAAASSGKVAKVTPRESLSALQVAGASSSVALLVAFGLTGGIAFHQEPANALSFVTWIIHVSSLLEWLAAMAYVWAYAEQADNARWRGLTWAMLPLHSSGLIACTYHFFYNHPSVGLLVVAQAALTTVGNACLAFAAFRISRDPKPMPDSVPSDSAVDSRALRHVWIQTCIWSVALSFAVKYGELWLNMPFEQSYTAATVLVLLPSALNAIKWLSRSKDSVVPHSLRQLF